MKRVLFDENMPRLLRRELAEFQIRTAQEEGWSALRNGELLRRAADARFEVVVTADKRMQFQQNISSFKIALVVDARSTRLIHMRPLLPQLRDAIEHAKIGTVLVVAAG